MRWVLEDSRAWCSAFVLWWELPTMFPSNAMFPSNVGAYSLWASDSTAVAGPLTVEMMREALRKLQHRDCPMYGTEDFDGLQQGVPVHDPSVLRGYPTGGRAFVDEVSSFYADARTARRFGKTEAYRRLRGLDAALPKADIDRPAKPRVPPHVRQHQQRLDGRRR